MSNNILGIFNGSDIEGLTALIEKLEQSSFDYLRLEGDGVKVVIGKNGMCDISETAIPAAAVPVEPPAVPEVKKPAAPTGGIPTAEITAQPAPAKPAETAAEPEGVCVVKSPSYGIFYAQSEPGAPTYVKLGDTVKKGDTLCLIEIMKTFNAISAEVDGEVVGIHVQNQEVLEPGQNLFSIKVK